jgi:hypothetical protein
MQVSEARINANRSNAQKSTGPSSTRGKEASRQNSLKHGLTGEGIVVPEGDAEEIQRRVEALEADMKPMSTAGVILIAQMATHSVRAENAARQELAATAMRVRHAVDDFEEGRIEQADALFDSLAEDPRKNLRKLRKMPEGVERMIEAWHDLRADLTQTPLPKWTAEHLAQAARLLGIKEAHARGSRIGALSRGIWGDFRGLEAGEGADLEEAARRGWSKTCLIERIDAEIAGLEAHYETLDFETIELDRLEAPERALFDASKGSALARRCQSDAQRGFFKSLKEFRQAEAEAAAKNEAAPTRPSAPKVGSFREKPIPADPESARDFPDAPDRPISTPLDRDGQPLRTGRPPKPTG